MKIVSITEAQISGVKLINFERFTDKRGFLQRLLEYLILSIMN